jgi:hypothetical protein
MIDSRGDNYEGHCPDKLHVAFERSVNHIIEDAQRTNRIRKPINPPSKVKREWEQLDKALRKLSLEAKTGLWNNEVDTFAYNPIRNLLKRIDLAIGDQKKGRSSHDAARWQLGRDAASLWTTHGGDLKTDEFVVFLETLIEDTGFGGGGKVRIDSNALAKDMREEFTTGDPRNFYSHEP